MWANRELKIFIVVLIALATVAIVTTPRQVMGAGRRVVPAEDALPKDPRELGLSLHLTSVAVGAAESLGESRFQGKQAIAPVSPPRAISFLPVVRYLSGGLAPVSVAIADVNGDGSLDVVLGNENSNSVSVLLGNGDGTFQAAMTYGPGGRGPRSVAVADMNQDGKPDLVVANDCASTCANGLIAVLFGNGDGTFQTAVTYDSGGISARSLAVADVNGDGKLDVVVTNQSSNTLGVLLGNGDGTLQPAMVYGSGGDEPSSVAVADVNGDGKLDLLVANPCASSCPNGGIGVLLGSGDGTFQAAVTDPAAAGIFPNSVAVSDLNGDGKADLVIGSNCFSCGDSFVSVQLGNGDGSFQPSVYYTIAGLTPIFSVTVADLNGDGKPDVALTGIFGSGGRAGSLQGNGDGTLQAAVLYNSSGASTSVAVADVNGDEKPDLLVANGGVYGPTSTVGVLINKSAFTPTTTVLASSPNPSLGGQVVTFTATVSSAVGAPPNGEMVTFKNGSVVLGTGSLSGGNASLTTSSLPVGTSTLTASYPGDSAYGVSTSPALTQVVNRAGKSPTSTSLASSLNPAIYGEKVTWTATVTSSASVTPTGQVKFTWNGYTIGLATLNGSGVATLTKSNLNSGSHPLMAVYMGDAVHLGSTSAIVNQVVQQATSSASLTSSPNPSTQGQIVTFTAKISSPTVIPTGPVRFTSGKTVLGTAQLTGGKAKLAISSLPAGSTRVTATYFGDSNIGKSSGSVIQTVQ
jgi:hypothetical protein